ncbi:hypothetical protein [Endozoicomonas arenosclerae]|uniref:hypothetical protein n=1 Tax=Endozoicomonas arenosclerae TaxID=1633495 RepID=UPI0007826FF1|nr:hypothetical protein [Endozoicomonas arenosclerae]
MSLMFIIALTIVILGLLLWYWGRSLAKAEVISVEHEISTTPEKLWQVLPDRQQAAYEEMSSKRWK